MRFSEFPLHERLHRAVEAAGFDTPTPIQAAAMPLALDGHDIVGTAQTGTGKTAAFVLPMLHRLLEQAPAGRRRTRALILTPTRELAEQIHAAIGELASHTNLRSATVYGGVGMAPQERALRNGTDIIVACPGRLLDHMGRGNTDFDGVGCVVLDEADRMLDMGFLPPITRIMGMLPNDRQTMLFSATFAPELNSFVNRNLRAPKRVECGIAAPAETVEHALYPVQQHLKTALLLAILERMDRKSVLVFTRTKHRANRVMQQLEREGHAAGALHSNKSQNQRQAALDAFRSGECRILVATDIAARGIDVATISHVINYDVPDCADSYIHRIGRTGRAERDGEAITFISSGDAGVLRDIERTLRSSIERRTLEGFDYNQPATQGDEFYRAPQQHQQRRSFGGHPSAHASAAQTPMPERPRTHHKPAPLATPPAPRPRPSSPTDYPAAEFRPTSKGRPVAPHARHAGKPGGRPGGDAQPMHAQDQGRNKPRTKLPAQGQAAPGKRTTAPGGGKPWGRGGNSLAASQRGRRRG